MNEKEYNKKYYDEHKEYYKNSSKIYRENNLESMKEHDREYYIINRNKIRERKRLYRLKNLELLRERGRVSKNKPEIKEKAKQTRRTYNQKNKSERNKKLKQRRQDDLQFRLSQNVRRRVYGAFKNLLNYKNSHTFEILGCSAEELKSHIENKFIDDMNWDNYGLKNGKYGWDVDHIIPCASAKTEEELIKLCHYTNLQPLWHIDNIKKSDKMEFRNEKS